MTERKNDGSLKTDPRRGDWVNASDRGRGGYLTKTAMNLLAGAIHHSLAGMLFRSTVAVLSLIGSLALPSSVAFADTEKGVLGIGLIVGEPTGISGKIYLGDDTAIDFAAGAAFIGRGLQIHGDYLWHPLMLENTSVFVLPAYAGVGLRILRRDDGDSLKAHTRIGVRLVGGVLFDFRKIPIDVFVEAALVGDYRTIEGDHLGLDVNLGAGVRYYF